MKILANCASFTKAVGDILKEFPEAASGHTIGFLKATEKYNFSIFLKHSLQWLSETRPCGY
jgi:hypothetical protein